MTFSAYRGNAFEHTHENHAFNRLHDLLKTEWATDLIRLGESWFHRKTGTSRQMAFISMPCDSPAAGLVALGAVIGDLRDESATDLALHQDSLFKKAEQYLKFCRDCDLEECRPDIKGCGYLAKTEGELRSIKEPRTRFYFSDRTNFEIPELIVESKGSGNHGVITRFLVTAGLQSKIEEWYSVDGHPCVIPPTSEPIDIAVLKELSDPALGPINTENARSSYSGLCLALRPMGAASTKRIFSEIVFDTNCGQRCLLDLLPVGRWKNGPGISRLSVFNERATKDFDSSLDPRLVIADGTESCIRTLRNRRFQHADFIGIVNRTDDHDRLQEIFEEMEFHSRGFKVVENSPVVGDRSSFGIDLFMVSAE